jgi:hypothetical protein
MNALKVLGIVGVAASLAFTTVVGEKDPLHKKKYAAMASEIKDGKPTGKKPVADEIEFKNGKVYSSYVWEKTEFQDVKYAINKDSTFTGDSGEELHYYEVEAITTDDKNQTINMTFVINGYDIEATYKLIKKDVVKKHFTSSGKEKVKEKKKKEKS